MASASTRPLGDRTTIIDLADRDEQDDDLFPLDASMSWFTRDRSRRVLPFTPVIQEFASKGTAEFGNRLVFEIGAVNAGDILMSVALQIRLGHWLPDGIVRDLQDRIAAQDPSSVPWQQANSLGTILIERAEFILEDQTLEIVDGDLANVSFQLFSDINTQFGIGLDALGRSPVQQLGSDPNEVFPTTNGVISCILPFSFQRTRMRNGFPLASVKPGTVRVAVTLRPFREVVRRANGFRDSCDQTPLGTTQLMLNSQQAEFEAQSASQPPQFADVRMVTQGVMVDGKFRQALLKAPFDRIQRDVQTFRFTEPIKQTVNTSKSGTIAVQLPLEANNPVEEIVWFIRRKAVSLNNEWTNQSSTLESEQDPILRPFSSMLDHAVIQVNGSTLVDETGDFFRREIASHHKGGIVPQSNFIYGYSFATQPGRHNPTGWFNASRGTDVRLRLQVIPPGGIQDSEWEVVVFVFQLNWVRFQNGIANRVFSS